jgi:Ca2+-binding EF-hand superfamily protein
MRSVIGLAVVAALTLPATAHARLEPSTGGRAALAAFNRLDHDGDRGLTRGELLSMGRQKGADALFAMLDANGDGRIAIREFGAANGALLARFDAYDANRDGFVTRREFPNFVDPRLVAALDRNGDGRLSLAEIRPAFAGARERVAPPVEVRKARVPVTPRPQPYCWVTGFGRDRWTLEAPVTSSACRAR